jgi:hypothetical protein
MSAKFDARPPRARITGFVYLLYFLTAVAAEAFVGRAGLHVFETLNLISHACYIAVTLLLYCLFSVVNKNLSLLAALCSLLGCANDVLALLGLAPYNISSLAFFGPYCLLLGYLIFNSTFLPKILGTLMALAGLGWLITLSPLASPLTLFLMALGLVAEASLMLWLLVKGVNLPRWLEQAGATQPTPAARTGGFSS